MPEPVLVYQVEAAVATLRLNRPQALNALDRELGQQLLAAVIEADEDPQVRCIVVTGSGGAFCAGGDVKRFQQELPRIGAVIKELTTYLHGAVSRLARAPKPVITAINGVAAGGGFSLALCGDIVVAVESARLTMAYAALGACPDGSSTWWLPRTIGQRRAFELYATNRTLTAREALEWGLVNRVYEDAQFPAAVAALARELADGPTAAFGHAKLLFLQSMHESLETQMELEAQAIAQCGRTGDFARGVEAFVRKQPARFEGR